jgi:hypothetical protein
MCAQMKIYLILWQQTAVSMILNNAYEQYMYEVGNKGKIRWSFLVFMSAFRRLMKSKVHPLRECVKYMRNSHVKK